MELGMGWGIQKWSKASLATSFWACLEDLKDSTVLNARPLIVTVAEKRGLWSRPCFVTLYSGNRHAFCWHSSCSFDLYIGFMLSCFLVFSLSNGCSCCCCCYRLQVEFKSVPLVGSLLCSWDWNWYWDWDWDGSVLLPLAGASSSS